jgi:hypothetical protein
MDSASSNTRPAVAVISDSDYRTNMLSSFDDADRAGQDANTVGTLGWSDRGDAFLGLAATMETIDYAAARSADHRRIIEAVRTLGDAGQRLEGFCRSGTGIDCTAKGLQYFAQIRAVRAQIESLST